MEILTDSGDMGVFADLGNPVPTVRESSTAGATLRPHRERVGLYVHVLWDLLRYFFALAGFVCLLLMVTTLTGWFGEGPRLVARDQRLAPSLLHPIRRITWAILVAGVWGGLTHLLGLDLILILVVAALVGLGYAFRRPRKGGPVE